MAPRLVAWAWRAAWVLFAGLLIAAYFIPAHRWFLAVYIAPLLPTGAWWLRLRSTTIRSAPRGQVWTDAAAFVLGGIRVFGGWGLLPHSGHMLFLTYAVATTSQWSFRLWALVLLSMTTFYKLEIRHDWLSWTTGLAFGLMAAFLWFWAGRHTTAVV